MESAPYHYFYTAEMSSGSPNRRRETPYGSLQLSTQSMDPHFERIISHHRSFSYSNMIKKDKYSLMMQQ